MEDSLIEREKKIWYSLEKTFVLIFEEENIYPVN